MTNTQAKNICLLWLKEWKHLNLVLIHKWLEVLFCVSYGKPRVYCSRKRISKSDQVFLEIALDGIDYICSWALLSQAHASTGVAALYSKIFTNTSLSCWNHIEYVYFSKSGRPFPYHVLLVWWPVSSDDMKSREEKLKENVTCLPLCSEEECTNKGWQTGGEKRGLVTKQKSTSSKKSKNCQPKGMETKYYGCWCEKAAKNMNYTSGS